MRSGQKWYFRKRTIMIELALLLIIIPLIVAVFLLFLNRNTPPLPKYYAPDAVVSELLDAEKLWSSRPFSSYRIEVAGTQCDKNLVEVHNEKVVTIYTSNCSKPVLTISDLFQIIQDDMSRTDWVNGVGCDLMVVHASFNPVWGYPEKIEYKQEWASRSNLNAKYYDKYVASRDGPCYLLAIFRYGYSVESFTPIFSETF